MWKGKLCTVCFKATASVHLVDITEGTVIQPACQSSPPTACDFQPWTGCTEAGGTHVALRGAGGCVSAGSWPLTFTAEGTLMVTRDFTASSESYSAVTIYGAF